MFLEGSIAKNHSGGWRFIAVLTNEQQVTGKMSCDSTHDHNLNCWGSEFKINGKFIPPEDENEIAGPYNITLLQAKDSRLDFKGEERALLWITSGPNNLILSSDGVIGLPNLHFKNKEYVFKLSLTRYDTGESNMRQIARGGIVGLLRPGIIVI